MANSRWHCILFAVVIDITASAFSNTDMLKVAFQTGLSNRNTTSSKLMTCDITHQKQCERICAMTTVCKSFFYNPATGVCQFHGAVFDLRWVGKSQTGLQYYFRSEADHDIPDGQQTVTTEGKSQQSRDEDRNRCKPHPELTTESTRTGDAEKVHYMCSSKLLHACMRGGLNALKSVLSNRNTNINCRHKGGQTPVMFAAWQGQVEVFDHLVSLCCDLTTVDKLKNNVLHLAVGGGNVDIVRKLIDREQCDIESRNRNGRTAIMVAAGFGHREVFQLLEGNGCNLTLVDSDNNNVLHLACASGNVNLVQYILSLKIFSIDVRGCVGRTPVMTAALYGRKEIVHFLVGIGCNLTVVNDIGNNILHVACRRYDNIDVIKYLLTLRAVKRLEKVKNKNGWSPEHLAKKYGLKKVVLLLKGKK